MSFIETQPWGSAAIKFIPKQFSREQIQQAAKTIEPNFKTPEDTFVMVDVEEDHVIAQVPGGPQQGIFVEPETSKKSLVAVLTKARDFLKNQYSPGDSAKDPIQRVKQSTSDTFEAAAD